MKWKTIAVDRDILSVDRHYYDIFINEQGVGGYYLWKTGDTSRHFLSPLLDILKRQKFKTYESISSDDEIGKLNEKNFFLPFDEIQGVVNDDIHKLLEFNASKEYIRIIFRKIPQYDTFVEALTNKIKDKVFNKEGDIPLSIELGY
ncbi:MAG: hypothetical protein INQ03_15240 [Candidatus Heimdallarchaeota archaeon]|nr:hypothetical protein [Candidatus Heimdallarchaeota archaeon]